ncbi:HD-GYP domain-containing protein [Sutcliffiella horikoshii]|uniref:HD-GYP domain-containing protein n=1 Tax=Sutcliffiella horikoshii TaxID=79883 RepID=A0A5D4T4H4_9BACI|nr:HD-GYP domain-containing protein [Sutcliffiella horikoshii]TYS69558.1 HD-GYP domain-containing protein [Sutcliffiella horikoshii]
MKISSNHIGKILKNDIYSLSGNLLLRKGTVLNANHVESLQKHAYYFDQAFILDEPHHLSREYFQHVKNMYETSIHTFQSIFANLEGEQLPPIDEIQGMLTPLIDKLVDDPVFTRYIEQVKSYDNYTYTHSLNVGIYSSLIGKLQGLEKSSISLLGQMGMFHDVGKLLIDKNILQKPGRLTEKEWMEIQKHTTYGYDLLKKNRTIDPHILQGALLHHERLDGSGYPTGIKHSKIPYFVQILSVADMYDALSSERSYRPKQNIFTTTKILIQEANYNRLNPAIVYPFVRYILSNHLREEVVLNNGKLAEIIFIHSDEPHLPIIKVDDHFIDLRKNKDLEILDFAN